MNARELQARLTTVPPPLLLNVLPDEMHEAAHLPGSGNACVYEMAFLAKVGELAPDPRQPLIVYGAGPGSLDALTAGEKLRAAGYTDVAVFEGGLEAWTAAGLATEGTGRYPGSPAFTGTFAVKVEDSLIRWTGRNLFNHHQGTVKLGGGSLELRDNDLVAARFEVAMETIACEDLQDPEWNRMLIEHLWGDDFFAIAQHPLAAFVATRVTPLAEATPGRPNFLLRGEFTLRGVTRELEFPIAVASADGHRLTAQAVFDLDRTEFGSLYGSGRFFRFLGKHIVNDIVHLHIKLHADRLA